MAAATAAAGTGAAEPTSMETLLDTTTNVDILTQEILLAASQHNVPALKELLRREGASANVQDAETGYAPLHAAILACEADAHDDDDDEDEEEERGEERKGKEDEQKDKYGREEEEEEEEHQKDKKENDGMVDMQKAEQTVRFLFENGAIWNDLDAEGDTPGDIAWRLGEHGKTLYNLIVEAGVRAELLLQRLDQYEALADSDGDNNDDEEMADATNDSDGIEIIDVEEGDEDQVSMTNGIIETLRPGAPMHFTELKMADDNDHDNDEDDEEITVDYLTSPLSFQTGRILDAQGNGVMMEWETPIMRRTAELLLPTPGLAILNLGHGMGIIDECIQAREPAAHHIVEAHPGVLAKMHETGWLSSPWSTSSSSSSTNTNTRRNVTVHRGKWQEVLPALAARPDAPLFDAIFFDTFAEDYAQFRGFFSEHVIALLRPAGRWSFFHGLGADRQVCYDVYTRVVESDCFEAGYDVAWESRDVNLDTDVDADPHASGKGDPATASGGKEGVWKGVKRKYWALDKYKLPLCTFLE